MPTLGEPSPPEPLSTRAARGAAWMLPASLGARAVGLIGTLLLARYLTPADYGVLTAASIVTLTASSVTTLGVGVFLVATPDTSRVVTFHATAWFLATGAAGIMIVLVLAEPIGHWVGAPGLVHYMPMLVLIIALERVIYVPERLLVRRLRFARLSIARAAGELLYTFVSVGLAAAGVGPMALIWGGLGRTATRFLAILPAVDYRDWLEPHRLSLRTLKGIIGFGMNVSGASVATFAMRRWDNLLLSRYFGADMMGAYNYAYNLADTPAAAVGEQLSDVMAASFPQVIRTNRTAAVVRACRLTALIMFPLAFGLGAVAPTLSSAVFNEKWSNVGSMLTWLCVLSAFRPLGDIIEAYFYAASRPRMVVAIEWLSLIGILAGIPLFSRGGIGLACGAVGLVFIVRALAAMWSVRRFDGVSFAELVKPMFAPLVTSAFMVAAVEIVRPALSNLPPTIQLMSEIAVGGAVYVTGSLLIARSATRDLLGLVAAALSARKEVAVKAT